MKEILKRIQEDLSRNFQQELKFSESFGDFVINFPKEKVVPLMKYLKERHKFDFMLDLCGVDYPNRTKRFDVVYHLYAPSTKARVRLKTEVGENETIDSICTVWKGANWFEREAYDMFGLIFKNHPNLRKLLTHQNFVGHPLRKDYDANHQQSTNSVEPIWFNPDPEYKFDPEKPLVPINIGPSHPATHGTLRIMAELDGETVTRCNVEIGYLHRCFEKMAETHLYNQIIPYTDRLNYCSAPMNNVGFCKTVERMLDVELPPKAIAMRVVLSELSRVIDHLVCIGTNAVDLGALTVFWYIFEQRERVYTLFEKLCGARLTVALTRIGGMAYDNPPGWEKECLETVAGIKKAVEELDNLLTENKIFIGRTQGVGKISAEDAIAYGYTGPCLRASGVNLDLRKAEPYYGYDQLDFDVPIGTNGDTYDRYLVRMEEMRQSLKIVEQVCKNMPAGDYTIRDKNIVLPDKKDVWGNIEGLMNHFMLVIKGVRPPVGEIYDYTEAANGELGFYLISDGGPKPYRLKVRPPCFPIYQSFPAMMKGSYVADVVAALGSLNIVAGELDR
ncbi:MAG: NADH dehydrogenase (quinone) subunit D [Oligoflexia bacterium]|nr:NADH dehydrogenase (quinone) subunit D [Oligoflexia bacterium]